MFRLQTTLSEADWRQAYPVVNLPTDCCHCGICCFSELPTYVRVTGDDWSRLDAAAERVAHFIGNRAYMKMAHGHCAALDVRTGPSGTPEFVCAVYAQRPQICRDLARGSPECEGERTVKTARMSLRG